MSFCKRKLAFKLSLGCNIANIYQIWQKNKHILGYISKNIGHRGLELVSIDSKFNFTLEYAFFEEELAFK